MRQPDFAAAFEQLTGKPPFPWQWFLYQRFLAGDFPAACNLPTGLGKTSVIHIWLLALAHAPDKVPRRLVYVVNRRTVVDQSTDEARRLRDCLSEVPGLTERLRKLCTDRDAESVPLAISTLRGQYADNREWCRDPAHPAIIVGTVDMVGSRLLFSGYGAGFKTHPLFAGFLGQDVLLVHDEAHLEPAFQALLEDIQQEQARCREFRRVRVLTLTATAHSGDSFGLTEADRANEVAKARITAKKRLALHPVPEKEIIPNVIELALRHQGSGKAILIFLRTVEAVLEVQRGLTGKGKVPSASVAVLTGTVRGHERDALVTNAVFTRFLPGAAGGDKTVYLIATAAGEVGVDISADHLVCDLTPFDSMAQRFGRVNRYGAGDACIDVVYEASPNEKKKDDPFDQRRWLTLGVLGDLNGDASPDALAKLDPDRRLAAFTPTPVILPTSAILFDAWALTTIREPLPGRPPVADWLHGIAEWQPPETQVAWREEVGLLKSDRFTAKELEDFLDDYPLKPHELLRDRTDRVFKHLGQLAEAFADQPVWVISLDDSVWPTTLRELVEDGKDALNGRTVLLPPSVGGLNRTGLLGSGEPPEQFDVSDEWRDEHKKRRRQRIWDEAESEEPKKMRCVRTIDTRPNADEEEAAGEGVSTRRVWRWFVRPRSADDDGSRTATAEQQLDAHNARAGEVAARIVTALDLPEPARTAVVFAASHHDDGKRRTVWQAGIGNRTPGKWLAKSGNNLPIAELSGYRHEFGSSLDVAAADGFRAQEKDVRELILHLIAAHHGRGRPHFPSDEAFDPEKHPQADADEFARQVPQRFAQLQRKHGRWGLAYLESLVRAADYLASEGGS